MKIQDGDPRISSRVIADLRDSVNRKLPDAAIMNVDNLKTYFAAMTSTMVLTDFPDSIFCYVNFNPAAVTSSYYLWTDGLQPFFMFDLDVAKFCYVQEQGQNLRLCMCQFEHREDEITVKNSNGLDQEIGIRINIKNLKSYRLGSYYTAALFVLHKRAGITYNPTGFEDGTIYGLAYDNTEAIVEH
jgi:hypothetical protein